ncbi:MAG: IS21 family transposase [Desulfobacteraceae bacterium]|jgi:transposase
MIDRHTVFHIHRLHNEGLSQKKIAATLHIDRKTVRKFLNDPHPKRPPIKRASKLDPFKEQIDKFLAIDPMASATVILQRITSRGYDGGITILKDYLRTLRGNFKKKKPFIRFESLPGEQCQVDWGHFGSIAYGDTNRKLYCLAVIECYSRLLYLEFTHSQRQETLHRGMLNAFRFFKGTTKQLVTDNMLTAVTERVGSLIRFNEAFLDFLRPFAIVPRACNPQSPHEKGKVEKGAIHYIRHNFWPLRSFTDLRDLQSQADHWRDTVANVRTHGTTGQRPIERFQPQTLRPLPEFLPDCRDTAPAKVYSDFSVRFDANTYTVPPWAIGKQVIVKADHHTLTIYLKGKAIATHTRSYKRKERIELPAHKEAALRQKRKLWRSEQLQAFISLGEEAKTYLERLSATHQPLKKNLEKLLALKDQYGPYAIIEAIKEATIHNAYGAHYIENILYQQMTPKTHHPPVKLKDEKLNRIHLEQPSLAEYDAFVIKRRNRS